MSRRHGQKKSLRRSIIWIAGVIAFALLCRLVVLNTGSKFLEQLANFLRIFLYLGLFAVWGVTIRRRVIQTQVRRQLVFVAVLMVGWLTMREFRWHLILNEDVRRWLWYAYYIPILLIPLMAFFVSLSLGRSEDYRLPRWAVLPWIPTLLLIAATLTNDLHERVFILFKGAAGTELSYSYGVLFYALCAWGILCTAAAFVTMLRRCRIPRTGRFLWSPLVPFAAALVYLVLYAARVPFVTGALGDFAVFECLVFTAFFEACIQSGLIQVNTRYSDLFQASVGTSARITDQDYAVHYAARGAVTLPPQAMQSAESGPVVLPDGKRLHNMPINGGHVVWTEDISELLDIHTELENVREELSDRQEIIQMEYAQEKERKTVEEQNRLYDLMQRKTQGQLDAIRQLAARYRETDDLHEKERILARIVVLGSFIKRRRDFVLAQEGASALSENVLSNAFGESFRSLRLLDIRGAYYVQTGPQTSGEALAAAYDFFEDVLEAVLDTARHLSVRVSSVGGVLRCSVETDGIADHAALQRKYPRLRYEPDEDGAVFLLPLEGGGSL